MSNKSKSKIINSLLSLMTEKQFEDITISEISERALLVRKTFYNNFNSKEELILYACRTLLYKFFDQIDNLREFSLNSFSGNFFIFCYSNKEFLKILMANNLYHIFIEEFHKMFRNIYDNPNYVVIDLHKEDEEMILSFHMGGIMKVIDLWAKEDFRRTPEAINKIYMTIVNDVVIEYVGE